MKVEFYFALLRARLEAVRALPSDTLLLVCAVTFLLLAIAILAWRKAVRRTRALEDANAALAADAATSRRTLDTERKWRLVAEKVVGQAPKPTGALEPMPPRELHELLERENVDPIQPAAKAAIKSEEIGAAVEVSQPSAPAQRALEPPPAATAPAGQKAALAKTKSARSAAKVAGLINRTILE